MRRNPAQGRRSEQGNVLVFVTLALIALLAFAAWSTETGQAWTAKGQLQAASDSAAMAGAGELLDPNENDPADPGAAIAAAQSFGAQNHSIG
ncbi:MAG: pilus assembly protein TadG-related protein, partial [Myxococcota bacterium]